MVQAPSSALSMTSRPDSRSLFGRKSLKQLHTKATHHYSFRSDEEDDDLDGGRNKKPEENQQNRLYLYKSKGQHLLTNTRILDSIVRKSHVKPNDVVLEIGPGTGNLTLKLLEAAEKVIAVEVDKRMVEVLNKRVAEHGFENKLTVICKDALKTEFPPFDLVIANIPYGISSPLVAKLVFGTNLFRSATLLLQKEFSRRLMAEPGDSEFNRLAVNVKLVAEVELVMDVSKREFVPPPKVDSSIVIIRPKPKIPNLDLDEWLAFTRTCFGKKNKSLGAILKQKKKVTELMRLSKRIVNEGSESDEKLFKERIVEVLKTSGYEDKRSSKMCHEEFLHLLSLFNQAGIYFHDHGNPKPVHDYASILATYSS